MCVIVVLQKWRNEISSSVARSNFCIRLQENATETYEKLKWAYGEHAVSRAHVFRCNKAFLDGRESVEDKPRSGRPCTSKTEENVNKVRAFIFC